MFFQPIFLLLILYSYSIHCSRVIDLKKEIEFQLQNPLLLHANTAVQVTQLFTNGIQVSSPFVELFNFLCFTILCLFQSLL